MSQNPQESQIQVELEKSGEDYLASLKTSPGMELFALSYIQSLTPKLITGIEILNLQKPRQIAGVSVNGKYTHSEQAQFFASYSTMQKLFNIGAILHGNPNIQFTTELSSNLQSGKFDMTTGMSVRFQKAKFNARINSEGKLSAGLMHAINPFMRFSLCS